MLDIAAGGSVIDSQTAVADSVPVRDLPCTVDSIEDKRAMELCCHLHYCFDTVAGGLVMNSQTAFADSIARGKAEETAGL